MPKKSSVKSGSPARKARRHGYRGYGSPLGQKGESYGGAVHWGRGFAGVGMAGEDASMLPPRSDLVREKSDVKTPPKDSSKKK